MKNRSYFGVLLLSVLASVVTTLVVNHKCNDNLNHLTKIGLNIDEVADVSKNRLLPDLTVASQQGVEAVVCIENRAVSGNKRVYSFFGIPFAIPQGETTRISSGSGVIISSDGYIVTNNHVVDGSKLLKVTLNDRRSYPARIIAQDPSTDIALIKIEEKDLQWLPFGNSDSLKLGEWVLAIGNPYNLTSTVTAGIVSAKARNLFVNDSDFRIESFIQTDAAVNTGNSGGALLNAKGEIVGINTVIKSPTGSYAGYSFAVPSSIVSKIVADMREFGDVRRGVLGVSMAEITDDFIRKMGTRYQIDEVEGVLVVAVLVGSAAQDAGIKPGDVILEVSGVKTNSPSQVQEIIARLRPDDKIKLLIKRGSEMKHFDVVLRNKNIRGN